MLNFINNLTPTQWIGLGVGGLMLIISSKDFLSNILKSDSIDIDDDDGGEIIIDIDEADLGVTHLVAKWEILSDACKFAGANEAYNKLQEVFPLLATIDDEE